MVRSGMSAQCGFPAFTLPLALTQGRFTSISVSATMMKIKEGLGGVQRKEAERREREKEEKEKLASKAEMVYAGNTEIAPPELIKTCTVQVQSV